MIVVNKTEVVSFQKSPWNALCKNGILFKIPLFSEDVSIKHHNSFISVQSIAFLTLQKSLGYAIDKFGRFYRLTEKIVIFKKIKNYKI